MKLYIFLRSIVWSTVFALLLIAASIISLIIAPNSLAPLTLGAGAIALSILSLLEASSTGRK